MICIAMGKDFAQRLCAKSLGKDFEQGFKTLRKVFAQEMCSFAYSWPHVVIWLAPVQNRAQRLWAKLWARIDPNGVSMNAVWVNPCSKLCSKFCAELLLCAKSLPRKCAHLHIHDPMSWFDWLLSKTVRKDFEQSFEQGLTQTAFHIRDVNLCQNHNRFKFVTWRQRA